ncbi:MAG: right-handed parallel beta-helix repeat-containing protein [Spirochaetota bacterium]
MKTIKIVWIAMVTLVALGCQVKNDESDKGSGSSAANAAHIIVEESGGQTLVAEGGPADTYTIRLSQQPASTVSISVKNTDGQLIVTPATLVFTESNWSSPQTVTVTAVDDSITEGPHTAIISQKVIGGDINFRNVAIPDINLQISDNDAPDFQIIVSNGSTEVAEGGNADTVQIKLSVQPVQNVTVLIGLDLPSQVTTSPSQLVFTPANWNTLQTVYFNAVDDIAIEDSMAFVATFTTNSAQSAFDGLSHTLNGTVFDNDKIIYVHKLAQGNGNGKSWPNAYPELRDALANAIAGQEIWVAAATYTPSAADRNKSFVLKNSVGVFGGFIGSETLRTQRNPTMNETILSGDLAANDAGFANNGENSYHVVKAVMVVGATLDGFSIKGGNANGSVTADQHGAGLYLESSTVSLNNLAFDYHWASGNGGSLYIENSTDLIIDGNNGGAGLNSTFSFANSQSPSGLGGFIHCSGCIGLTVKNLSFSGASAQGGGAISIAGSDNAVFDTVTISSNTTTGSGGGMYIVNSASVNILSSTFSNNTITGGAYGGAIRFSGASGNGRVQNCTFNGNRAISSINGWAGAIYLDNFASFTIQNSTFTDNRASNAGAVYSAVDDLSIIGSTFSMNRTENAGAGPWHGGALFVNSASAKLTIQGSTFDQNQAKGWGGAVYVNSASEVHISGASLFSKNHTKGNNFQGGAMFLGTISGAVASDIQDTTFTENTTDGNAAHGGALSLASDVSLNNVTLSGNKSTLAAGGALYCNGATITLTGGAIENNEGADGGGIYLNACNNSSFSSVIIKGNTATSGTTGFGGGLRCASSQITMTEGQVEKNTARNGGGVYLGGCSSSRFTATILRNNYSHYAPATAAFGGGAMNIANSNGVKLHRLWVDGNRSEWQGGGIHFEGGTDVSGSALLVTSSVFSRNIAQRGSAISLMSGAAGTRNFYIVNNTLTLNIATGWSNQYGAIAYQNTVASTMNVYISNNDFSFNGNTGGFGVNNHIEKISSTNANNLLANNLSVMLTPVLPDYTNAWVAPTNRVRSPKTVDRVAAAGTSPSEITIAGCAGSFVVGEIIEYDLDAVPRTITSCSGSTLSISPPLLGNAEVGKLITLWGSNASNLIPDFHFSGNITDVTNAGDSGQAALVVPAEDYDGNARVQGSVDKGAFERP